MSWKPCQLPAVFPWLLHPEFFFTVSSFPLPSGCSRVVASSAVCVTMQVGMDMCAFGCFCKMWINSTSLVSPKTIIYLGMGFFK